MVKRKIDKNPSKLGIVTLYCNIPEGHISLFVEDFIEEFYLRLNIKEPKNKKGCKSLPIDSILKLLVYAKIEYVESTKYIEDMTRHHEIYRFISDDVQLSEHSVQRYRREYGCYFEVLI